MHSTHQQTTHKHRGGLAILAMRLWSQGPYQSPLQNVKKGPFGGIFEAFLSFLFEMSQRPFDPSSPLHKQRCRAPSH
jgi:hypothetical protein